MSGLVPAQRYEPTPDEIISATPISSGRHWLPMASLSNWCNGYSAQLVPACVVDKTIVTSTTGVLHFSAKTRAVATERIWTLFLRSTSAGCQATIKAPASTGTAVTIDVARGRDTRLPIIYRELLGSSSSAVTDLTIEIAASAGDIEIDTVSCFEQQVPSVALDTTTLRPRERIYDNGDVSATGVYAGSLGDIRRIGLYAWAVPVVTPVTTTSAAYVDLLSLGVPVLGPYLDSATAPVYWSAYAKVSSGTANVRLTTSHSGVSDAVTISATSFAWTTPRLISIDAEDMAAADGLRSSTFDNLMPAIKSNGGVTLSIAGISVWNEEI